MPLSLIALAAAAAASAGIYATPEYRAYHLCLDRALQAAAAANATPEDMPITLRLACPDQRTDLEDAIRRGADGGGSDDNAAARIARRTETVTGGMLDDMVRRYAVYAATGLWPKG